MKLSLLHILCGCVFMVLPVTPTSVKVNDVLESAIRDADELRQEERKAALKVHGGDKVFRRVSAFLSSTKYVKKVGYTARAQLNAMKKVQQLTGLRGQALLEVMKSEFGCSVVPNRRVRIMSDTDLPPPQIDECPFPEVDCDENNVYRSIDGTCNNLMFPHDGRANRALSRFIQPDYYDGIEEPRKAKSGSELPSVRNVSLAMFEDIPKPSGVHTLMHMTFGQLLDHDMDKTAVSKLMKPDDTLVDFECGESGCETEGANNTECFPIHIYPDDPDFSHKQCLMFVRSQEFMKDGCEIGPREQVNTITSWLDASFVYGSSVELMTKLRDLSDPNRGKLKMTDNAPNKPLLPQGEDSACRDLDDTVKCFLAGDGRRNEQVGLIAMHTAFARLHNYYEEQLHQVNPGWSGEKLFMESRRLLTAVWQNIVYNEYLPILFGPKVMKKYKLKLEKNGYFEGYDPLLHGDTANVFATCAFRFGHSQITEKLRFTDKTFQNDVELHFSSVLFRPRPIYESPVSGTTGVDSVIFGMISQPVENSDRFFSKQMTASLFSSNPPHGKGTDLSSLNLQRGRDHGIPGYTKWREFCGLPVPKTFEQLTDFPADAILKFQELYEDVSDIDMFAAGLAEYPVEHGLVGPTFACILAHQFRIARSADRFWFETNDPVLKFSPEQLKNIRQMTLSRVFCDTLDDVDKIQKFSMLQPQKVAVAAGVYKSSNYWEYLSLFYKGSKNKRRECSRLKDMDFSLWAEV